MPWFQVRLVKVQLPRSMHEIWGGWGKRHAQRLRDLNVRQLVKDNKLDGRIADMVDTLIAVAESETQVKKIGRKKEQLQRKWYARCVSVCLAWLVQLVQCTEPVCQTLPVLSADTNQQSTVLEYLAVWKRTRGRDKQNACLKHLEAETSRLAQCLAGFDRVSYRQL